MNINSKLGNYPGILITVSLTVALFLIGFCGWIAITSKELIKYVRQNVEVQVYMDKSLDSLAVQNLRADLVKLDIAETVKGKPAITLITKDKAAEVFFQETRENYQEVLGENPFSDAYNIKLKEENITESRLQELQERIAKIPGVSEVDYPKDFLKGIISNVNKIYKVVAIIVLIFFVATLLLINNTIKLALYSQRFIIRTMQLVGATDWFIQRPFLVTGFFQGLLAAVLSIVLIYLTQYAASAQVEGLTLLANPLLTTILFLILLVLGPVIGILSTYQSVARYNKMDLDKLY
ncbi:cell division protein FtsX [Leadbetterella sp. DM7]|uniref:cell division protein FtsX n=1 Tax=Leadbetterella sp. DM7 TaxID=3235085 RepID=UPI00349EB900